MRSPIPHFLPWIALIVVSATPVAFGQSPAFPSFKHEEIDKSLTVGYAVSLADVNNDGRPDIIVCDSRRVIWFENPSWKMRTIIEGQTKPDNVAIDPYDVDGDGQLDVALGAGWKGFNTKDPGTIQWLKRGKTLDEPWTLHAIAEEASVHRLRWADLDGKGKAELIVAPLLGAGTTQGNNWNEKTVRLLSFAIPNDPVKDAWPVKVLNDELHVMHNFAVVDLNDDKKLDLIVASYEGVSWLRRGDDGRWVRSHIGAGNQERPNATRGSSEIKLGRLRDGKKFIATIEPWHGNQVVVYTPQGEITSMWKRHVIDEELKWGHAVWCADLDNDGSDELVIGIRDPVPQTKIFSGVKVYKPADLAGGKWAKNVVDSGGVATEDLAAADLNGDKLIDLVAVGRQTKNVKIYWNEGTR
jgi:hypothetical protein